MFQGGKMKPNPSISVPALFPADLVPSKSHFPKSLTALGLRTESRRTETDLESSATLVSDYSEVAAFMA